MERRRLERSERRRRVLPPERDAGKGLEPGLALRVRRCGLELEMQVWPGRVAGRADESDRRAGAERRSLLDGGVAVGEVAVRPDLAVERPDGEADPAARVRSGP